MKITTKEHNELMVLSLRGELTLDEVDQFRKAVVDRLHDKARDFVLDLSQVQFIDSLGLESLVWLQDQCLERLGQIRLAGCSDNIKTILRITRLDDRFEVHEHADDAIRSLQA